MILFIYLWKILYGLELSVAYSLLHSTYVISFYLQIVRVKSHIGIDLDFSCKEKNIIQ